MLLFVVTVKSLKLSSDWDNFSLLVNRCVTSLTRQTSARYEIVVVCDERPTSAVTGPRIHYVHLPGPATTTWGEGEADRARRLMAGARFGERFAPTHMMNVDCDDLVHRDVAGFVAAHEEAPGWFFERGYAWRNGARWAWSVRHGFNDLCGTCLILRHDLLDGSLSAQPLAYGRTPVPPGSVWFDHSVRSVGDVPLARLPFAAAVYCMDTGENIRSTDMVEERTHAAGGRLRFIVRQARRVRPRPVDGHFLRDFGMTASSRPASARVKPHGN